MDETLASPTCRDDSPSSSIQLSIIIPAFNAAADLNACLASIAGHVTVNYEIIVVDDASTDSTPQVALAHGARLFSRPSRGGPASARNWGAHEACGQWLFFIDADVTIHPGTIERAFSHLQNNKELDALFGSYDDAPGDPGLVSQFRNLLHHHVHQTGDFSNHIRPAETFWTGCGFIKRSVFLSLGGFNHWLYERPAIEDIEFGYRLKDAGHQTALARDVLCKHHKRWTLVSMPRTDFLQRGLPWSLLMLRSTRPANDLNVDRKQKIAALAAASCWLGLVVAFISTPLGIALGCISLFLMIGLNRGFFQLLWCRGGLKLSLAGVGLMNLYYLVCLSSYALAVGIWLLRDRLGLIQQAPGRSNSSGFQRPLIKNAVMTGDLSQYLRA